MSRQDDYRSEPDAGVVGVMVALLAVVFILLLGLVVNWGLTNFKREESQQLADAAAYGLALRCAQEDAAACADADAADDFVASIEDANPTASSFDLSLVCLRTAEDPPVELRWDAACDTTDVDDTAGFVQVAVVPLSANDDTFTVPFDNAAAQRAISTARIGRASFSNGSGGGPAVGDSVPRFFLPVPPIVPTAGTDGSPSRWRTGGNSGNITYPNSVNYRVATTLTNTINSADCFYSSPPGIGDTVQMRTTFATTNSWRACFDAYINLDRVQVGLIASRVGSTWSVVAFGYVDVTSRGNFNNNAGQSEISYTWVAAPDPPGPGGPPIVQLLP